MRELDVETWYTDINVESSHLLKGEYLTRSSGCADGSHGIDVG